MVFVVRKFHRYLYRRRFTLLTDRKLLLSIFGSKTGVSAYSANRLQRWEFSLLSYDFRIEYRKTNHFGQADALSRLIASKLPEPEDVIIAKIEKDIQALPSDVICLLPEPYWQGIDRDIEEQVKNCSACQDAVTMPAWNEPSPWPTPNCAWERIHVDFAGPLEGLMFLIVVDAFSKWPEVVQMSSTTATGTIKELTRFFAQQGFPKVLVSDNGMQFTSQEFQSYCQQHGIQHIRSPPYHPQSNGQAERFMDTFKRTFQKLRGEGATSDVIQKFLWTYRSTMLVFTRSEDTGRELHWTTVEDSAK